MSWLFGMKSNTPDMSQFMPPPPPADDNNNGNRTQGHVSEAYRFDSTALERAAKAAKELESNSRCLLLLLFSVVLLLVLLSQLFRQLMFFFNDEIIAIDD